ncbi:MAG: SBBP repeat-containing protein, partial [Candidatus Thorarchaeota archaeon]
MGGHAFGLFLPRKGRELSQYGGGVEESVKGLPPLRFYRSLMVALGVLTLVFLMPVTDVNACVDGHSYVDHFESPIVGSQIDYGEGFDVSIEFETYFGGEESDYVTDLEFDGEGNVVLLGYTASSVFSVTDNPILEPSGHVDVFLAKFLRDGSLSFLTFFGGSSGDYAADLAIDVNGSEAIWVCGTTSSYDIPASDNAIQSSHNGGILDGFIVAFTPEGIPFYSTYLGGSGIDEVSGIDLDGGGNVYVTGATESTDLPVNGSIQSGLGGLSDLFIIKLGLGRNIEYSTFLGGNGRETTTSIGSPIDVAENGTVVIVGSTNSTVYPFAGAPTSEYNDTVGTLVSILDSSGNLSFVTVIESGSDIVGGGAVIGPHGAVYVTATRYDLFSVFSEEVQDYIDVQRRYVRIAKIKPYVEGDVILKDLVGVNNQTATSLSLDTDGNLIVGGHTNSPNFPAGSSQSGPNAGFDSFVSIMNPENLMVYLTVFVGGSDDEINSQMAFDRDGRFVVSGSTNSIDLEPINAVQMYKTDNFYSHDGFVTVLRITEPRPPDQTGFWITTAAISVSLAVPSLVILEVY